LRRDAGVEIRHDHVIELEEARSRKHIVGIIGGIGLEQIGRRRCSGLETAMLLFHVMIALVSGDSSRRVRSIWLIECADVGLRCAAVR
jgi:hypothetical protein